MGRFHDEIEALFDRLEINLKKAAVMEGDDLEYYEDAASDIFFEAKLELVTLISDALAELIESKVEFNSLPPLAICSSIEELNSCLSEDKDKLPYVNQFTESETLDSSNWQPLYDALREYFDEDAIDAISSQYEFDLAKTAFLKILEISPNFRANFEFEEFSVNVDALMQSSFASPDDKTQLDFLFEELIPPTPVRMTPTVKVYIGSTGGLEPRFIEWLEKHHKAQTLFDDNDLDFDSPNQEEDQDWENLLSAWLETDPWPQSSFENYCWIPIDFKAPIDYEYGDTPIFFEIHQLSQLIRDPNNSRISELPESLEHYKIIMYRTGERHEYNAEIDRSLLALQVLLFHESSSVPIEKIEAEVHWIRLEEKAYPLLGLTRDELEEVSQTYLRAQ